MRSLMLAAAAVLAATSLPVTAGAQEEPLPGHLRDRGRGVPSSMFGTTIRHGQLRFYPYWEYYHDDDYEYKPAELGYGLDQDFRGQYRAHEGLIFLGYGISEAVALEVEAAVISATLTKSPSDTSAVPPEITESGLGDVESQLRVRWMEERGSRPELFSFFEVVFPLQKNRTLIGTQDWEVKAGVGVIRGMSWGTVTLRAAVEYDAAEQVVELGEYAVEYLKRISRPLRIYAGIEGSQDEVELITELQVHLHDYVFLKLNNAFGLTSKATDWAPEIGVMFAFRVPTY